MVPVLAREDWIRAALEALAEHGAEAVAVEPLARKLKVTKGSFYWHFRDRSELLSATLDAWEEIGTAELERELALLPDPRQQLRHFFARALEQPLREQRMRLEVSIAAAAPHDPEVARALARVSERRLNGFVAIYRRMGLRPASAQHWGALAFATSLGLFQVVRTLPKHFDSDRVRSAQLDLLLAQLTPDR
jgi:AcrR family transcriptional regulator